MGPTEVRYGTGWVAWAGRQMGPSRATKNVFFFLWQLLGLRGRVKPNTAHRLLLLLRQGSLREKEHRGARVMDRDRGRYQSGGKCTAACMYEGEGMTWAVVAAAAAVKVVVVRMRWWEELVALRAGLLPHVSCHDGNGGAATSSVFKRVD